MAPPSFSDLGKSARDILTKTYNFGFIKLDSTTKSGNLEFKTAAAHDQSNKQFNGGVDIKFDYKKYGLTVTEKWNTRGLLNTDISVENKFAEGTKVSVDSSFDCNSGKRSANFKSSYKNDNVHFNLDSTVHTAPVVSLAGVVRHQDWLGGLKLSVDSSKANKTPSHHLVLGYSTPNYDVFGYVRNGQHFGSNFYHRVSRDVELAASCEWSQGEEASKMSVGGKFNLDDSNVLRARLTNNSDVAVALTHTLRPGFKANLSLQSNLKALNDGANHKFGFGLEYESK